MVPVHGSGREDFELAGEDFGLYHYHLLHGQRHSKAHQPLDSTSSAGVGHRIRCQLHPLPTEAVGTARNSI
jgi:hypothetical protein